MKNYACNITILVPFVTICIFVTFIIMNEKTDFVNFDYCFVCSKEKTFNILISSKTPKFMMNNVFCPTIYLRYTILVKSY
jgi:hypothetical protein